MTSGRNGRQACDDSPATAVSDESIPTAGAGDGGPGCTRRIGRPGGISPEAAFHAGVISIGPAHEWHSHNLHISGRMDHR